MKNIKWSSLFIGLICLCSCVDLTELNENPTKATSISPHLLIPTIQLTHSQYMQNTIRYFIYPGAFVNHWIGGWSMQEYGGKAKKNIAYMDRLWVAYYPDIIKNAVALVSQTTDNPEEINLNAIGRILKVEAFLKLTDYYGDIPYFEAGKIYNENIVKPRYDKQEAPPPPNWTHRLWLRRTTFTSMATSRNGDGLPIPYGCASPCAC